MTELVQGAAFAGCRLEGVAARGGMGVVWKARQLALDRPVALKAIAPDLAENDEFRERFQRESHLTASIDHPNVIPVYEAGELDGTLYLIMRWVDGTDLARMLRQRGKLTPGHALTLLRSVASALSAAHRRGLIHRDIKPANVLIARDDDHVYLTDFGIARMASAEAMTATGALVGTIDYTAPERFEGGHGDVASDIYAFGCMLYETLTGNVPFPRPTDVSKLFAHIHEPPPMPRETIPDLPESVDAIVAKAMAKHPEDRYQTAAELVEALTAARAELDPDAERAVTPPAGISSRGLGTMTAVRTRPPTPAGARPTASPPPAPPGRRRRRALYALPVAVIAVGAIIALVLSSGSGGRHATGSSTPTATPAATASPDAVASSSTGGLTVTRVLRLTGSPGSMSSGASGYVGVTIPGAGQLDQLTRGAARVQPFPVGGHPGAIAEGPFGSWLGCSGAGGLVLIGFVAEIHATVSSMTECPTVVAANLKDASVWAVYRGGQLVHYDRAGRRLTSTKLGSSLGAVAVGEGAAWAADGSLQEVSPATGVAHPVDVGPGTVSVTLDRGVWTAHAGGFVTKWDPRPAFRRVTANLTVAPSLTQISAVEGAPWIWALGTQSVYRISYAKHQVMGSVTFRAAPVAIAANATVAWVALADGRLVAVGAGNG
jgi:serine/threonine protein kinase